MENVNQKELSRKEKRKQERKQKKQKKSLYFSRKYGHLDKELLAPAVETSKPKKKTRKPRIKKEKELTAADVRKLQLKEANEEEDKSIRRLEKILKLNKRKTKNIPKAFAADGLDYLLELIDRREDLQIGDFDMNAADMEIGDDLSKALGRNKNPEQADNDNSDQEDFDSESDDGQGDGFFVESKASQEIDSSNTSKSMKNQIKSSSNESDSKIMLKKEGKVSKEINSLNTSGSKKRQNEITAKRTDNKNTSKKEWDSDDDQLSEVCSDNDFSESEDDYENEAENVDSTLFDRKHKKELINKRTKMNSKTVRWADEDDLSDSAGAFKDSESNSSEENLESMEPTKEVPDRRQGTKYWEDIYGRLRDTEGNVIDTKADAQSTSGKYVPPAKRLQATTEDAKKREVQLRIQKQMRGLLNKLNESNMKHICDQIENMYRQHSRNDMNEALVHLVQQSVVLSYLMPEKLVMEHALLIAILHCNIGSEVGAHCLQYIALALDAKLNEGEMYGDGKEVDNLLLLLCHLYTFKVTHSLLIYDILKRFTENFQAKDVELILLILRSVGFVLRKDDPTELKSVIFSLQSKAGQASNLADQTRIRFMLDTVMAIRNNNMQKIPNYDPSLSEHLRKALRSFQRKGTYVQALHISLKDLLEAEERGRWWIVGSAWKGTDGDSAPDQDNEQSLNVMAPKFSDEVLDLARKQRMNTEIRKNIFCIIMSAEDYMDAFEKLLRLGLKNQQDREFIHVAFDCCLQEKHFNPFYAYLSEKFCIFDRKYQMALQFLLWDKFKELGKMKNSQVTNLAQYLVHLFTRSALPMSVLKVIQLAEMDKVLVKFLRQILLAILLHESEEVCRSVFLRIAPSPKLQAMREGLRLFMMHFLLRNQSQLEEKVATLLQDRVNLAIDVLNSAADKKHR